MDGSRCLRCRTVGYPRLTPSCPACGGGLWSSLPSKPPAIAREATRDSHVGRIVLGCLCAFYIVGLLVPHNSLMENLVGVAIPALAFLSWVLMSFRIWSSRFAWISKIFLTLCAAAAALFGCFFLVAMACASGTFR